MAVAAPGRQRGSVISAFFVVAYLSLSLPAIAAGFTATDLGIESTFRVFGAAVVALTLVVGLRAARRPAAASAARPA